jgi:hypothetical protein
MVKAKFVCNGVLPVVNREGHVDGYSINFHAVYNDPDGKQNEENKQYWKLTPGGSINLYTVNENAASQFKAGKQYFVEFTEAE